MSDIESKIDRINELTESILKIHEIRIGLRTPLIDLETEIQRLELAAHNEVDKNLVDEASVGVDEASSSLEKLAANFRRHQREDYNEAVRLSKLEEGGSEQLIALQEFLREKGFGQVVEEGEQA